MSLLFGSAPFGKNCGLTLFCLGAIDSRPYIVCFVLCAQSMRASTLSLITWPGATSYQFLVRVNGSPGKLGNGYNASALTATASNRLEGIRFPGNGSRIMPVP